jgi:hypothetical protein
MHLRSTFLYLGAGLALALAGTPGRAADLGGNLSDEQTLRAVSLTTDGAGLLEFFRKRSQSALDPAEVAALITQLGDKSNEVREKATGTLVALGPVAVPQLRQAAKDPDEPEVAVRAKRCLQAIEGNFAASVPVAAARLLAQRPRGPPESSWTTCRWRTTRTWSRRSSWPWQRWPSATASPSRCC